MPAPKFEQIYKQIKTEIETGIYRNGDYLPSEHSLTARFDCTRNTVRRALAMLEAEGYVLPLHGRGVQVIYIPQSDKSLFTIGGIESFAEAAERNNIKYSTKLISFELIKADEKLSLQTGFDIGEELYLIKRLRIFNGKAIIYDTNMFLRSETEGLTVEIAKQSIYQYLERELHMTITTSRRRVAAEKATREDKRYLDLGRADFVLSVTGQVFNSRGIMFEYTQSRHVPDQVTFIESAVRQKI